MKRKGMLSRKETIYNVYINAILAWVVWGMVWIMNAFWRY